MTAAVSLRVGVAQSLVSADIPTAEVVETATQGILGQMAEAAGAGARVVFFAEGTLSYPSKRWMSSQAPDLGEADWSRTDWGAISHSLHRIRRQARTMKLWTVVGAPHRLSEGRRPHNSLFVFGPNGRLVTRYDKRRLSTNEAAYLYTPGTAAITVDIEGVRFGFLLCLETLFPELFMEYADLGVDAVVIASAPDPNFAMLARSYAFLNGIHVAIAFGASEHPHGGRSGVCSMHGWVTRCSDSGPAVVVADLDPHGDVLGFQRAARSGALYAGRHAETDERSTRRDRL